MGIGPMRLLTALFGLASIAWGLSAYPALSRYAPLEQISAGIIDRYAYKPQALAAFTPLVEAAEHDPYCQPEAMLGAAVVRLRLAEDAIGRGARDAIDADLQALDRTTRQALSCSPADPFLWMTLSWLDGAREGFKTDQLQFLRLSYATGPNEGWVAVRRNRFALSMFERLPADLADLSLSEFARMLESGIFEETIAIFTGPGWSVRDKLLPRLAGVQERYRDAFAKALNRLGYDVTIPGITRAEFRPWN
jgi:hypothetical protein